MLPRCISSNPGWPEGSAAVHCLPDEGKQKRPLPKDRHDSRPDLQDKRLTFLILVPSSGFLLLGTITLWTLARGTGLKRRGVRMKVLSLPSCDIGVSDMPAMPGIFFFLSFVHSFVDAFIHSSIHSFIYSLFVCLFVCLFVSFFLSFFLSFLLLLLSSSSSVFVCLFYVVVFFFFFLLLLLFFLLLLFSSCPFATAAAAAASAKIRVVLSSWSRTEPGCKR